MSSVGEAQPGLWLEGQVSLCAGLMTHSQSTITQWGLDFLTARGGIDRGDHCFRSRLVRVVGVWREFSSGDKT